MSQCILASELPGFRERILLLCHGSRALPAPPRAFIIPASRRSAVGLRDRGAPPVMVYSTLCCNLSSHISELKKACQKGAIMKGNLKTFINIETENCIFNMRTSIVKATFGRSLWPSYFLLTLSKFEFMLGFRAIQTKDTFINIHFINYSISNSLGSEG